MVESAIYFLIGFFSSALLALMAAPAITRRAYRLAAARARLLAPLSETQARADRDALRAQHAIEVLKMEQRVAAATEELTRSKVQLGRRETEIVRQEALVSERAAEIARQRDEIADLVSQNRSLDATVGALQMGLYDLTLHRDRLRDVLVEAQVWIGKLETDADEKRAAIATLETRNAGLEIALGDLERGAAEAAQAAEDERTRLASAVQANRHRAATLEERLADAIALQQVTRGEAEGRAGEAARLRERLADMERALARGEKSRDELALQSNRQLARLAEREAALERAEAQRRDEAQRFQGRLESAGSREGALAERLRGLTAAQAAEGGALAAARAERLELKRELDALAARLAESQAAAQTLLKGDHILRQSIAKLGREIARTRGEGAEDEFVPQVVSFARRENHSSQDDHPRERPLVSER